MQLGRRRVAPLRATNDRRLSSSSFSRARNGITVAFGCCLFLVPLVWNVVVTKHLFSSFDDPSSLSSSSSSAAHHSTNIAPDVVHTNDGSIRSDTAKNSVVVSPSVPTTASVPVVVAAPWQSKYSAVLALASGLNMGDYQHFVGSLRATGFSGHIILGISKHASTDILEYLANHNVTTHFVESADQCTHHGAMGHNGQILDTVNSHEWHCPKNYPDYKISWARFFMYEDWLKECPTCTDGIMLTDARDAFFQADPFVTAVKLGQQYPLLVFEEHPNMSNKHWLTDIPVRTCKKHTVGPTRVLCSGSIMGSREGIMEYLDIIQTEMADWMTKPDCRIDMRGDDQSIHNYLYYTQKLKNAKAIPHRTGAIHVVGYEAARIFETAQMDAKARGLDWPVNLYVQDNNWHNWLPDDPIEKFDGEIQANSTYNINLIDRHTGQIVNMDGSPSAQVHQYDRFGPLMNMWFDEMVQSDWPYNKK